MGGWGFEGDHFESASTKRNERAEEKQMQRKSRWKSVQIHGMNTNALH